MEIREAPGIYIYILYQKVNGDASTSSCLKINERPKPERDKPQPGPMTVTCLKPHLIGSTLSHTSLLLEVNDIAMSSCNRPWEAAAGFALIHRGFY